MNTYCDKINDNELSLHSTPEEMAFVLDLINAVEHPIATKLRNRIEPHVRSNANFQLNIDRKIEICGKCKGEGTLMVGNVGEMHNHDKENCYRCHGDGRRIVITSKRYENISGLTKEPEG